ncbi:MAG: hypothetical protein JWP06_371 [Candidatus Saccharibacteria bacterium]|jgi:hypothetical protein|nr:hypothetical protein [Candidatus Saccharibacteria bacterium]
MTRLPILGSDDGAWGGALRPTPLRPTTPYSLNGPWAQVDTTDIGVSVTYDPGNTNHTWSQD